MELCFWEMCWLTLLSQMFFSTVAILDRKEVATAKHPERSEWRIKKKDEFLSSLSLHIAKQLQ